MAEPQLEIRGLDEVNSLLDQLPKATFDDVKESMRTAIKTSHKKVQQQFVSGPLHSRTGEARRSFKTELRGADLGSLKASVFSGQINGQILAYIPIHEFGGTINAIGKYLRVPGGPYLNIPLRDNLTEAGVMRESAKEVFDSGGKLFKSSKGNWIVSKKDGTPMFVLKQSVKIKARLGFYDIADKETDVLIKKLSDLLPKTWGGL